MFLRGIAVDREMWLGMAVMVPIASIDMTIMAVSIYNLLIHTVDKKSPPFKDLYSIEDILYRWFLDKTAAEGQYSCNKENKKQGCKGRQQE